MSAPSHPRAAADTAHRSGYETWCDYERLLSPTSGGGHSPQIGA